MKPGPGIECLSWVSTYEVGEESLKETGIPKGWCPANWFGISDPNLAIIFRILIWLDINDFVCLYYQVKRHGTAMIILELNFRSCRSIVL